MLHTMLSTDISGITRPSLRVAGAVPSEGLKKQVTSLCQRPNEAADRLKNQAKLKIEDFCLDGSPEGQRRA
jgi:hypothetical protein